LVDFAIMLAMERVPYIAEEHLRAIGENNLESYREQASVSNVPSSFYRVLRQISYELPLETSINGTAELLFGFRFASEDEAFTALNYAEAVSIIKDAFKEKYPGVDEKDIDSVVGYATLWEQNKGEEVEDAKQKVEDHFEDPRNVLNFSYLEQIISNPAA